ncbi:Zinc finger RING type [Echinococcus multilocularis]|uniref:Zinc finger RING type n=1 Tax=Echinococcus multilocularis TaxID=6211 RepID=A0A068YES4_ECHMU|nr:Zinc finger RING type [Echinococcus multilocularis]
MSAFGGSCSRLSAANLSFRNPRRGSSHANLPEAKGSAKTSSRVKVMNLKPLEEMVTCPIDLNFLEDPRLLPCGHVFCRQCLDSYIRQIVSRPQRGASTSRPQLPCPICRAPHMIPESNTARDYPKSFNHSMILEYIRSQAFMVEPSDSGTCSGGPSSSHSSFHSPSPMGRRKTSLNVTSDALNSLVADIVALKRSKSNTVLNLAQLLHGVRKLVESSELKQCQQQEQQSQGPPTPFNLPEPEMVEPSAPPALPSAPETKRVASSRKQRNDTSRRSSSGRFHSAASHALGTGTRRSDTERLSYVTYRELLTARTMMMRNSDYVCLWKALGQCDGMPRETIPHIGMHLLPNQSKTHVIQYTIGTDGTSGVLHLWRRRVPIHPGRDSFTISANLGKSSEKDSEAILRQRWSLDDISNMGKLEVQYVRFFKNRIYMTVIVRQPGQTVGISADTTISADLIDPGLVICCALPDPDHKFTSDELAGGDSARNRFSTIDVSSIFLRDAVGMTQLERPTVAGLDIDRVTGAIYVALCANAMVCRLNPDDLKQVDREWFLNNPQLSPSFLCIARQESEVWASCPLDDKVFILDLTTDTFTQFTPSVMFNIVPSHIICTTDERIMLLDKKWSRVYWLQRVQQSICSQRIDHTMKERKKRGIDIIQPVDDTLLGECLAASRAKHFCGGIMCADRKGAYLIYPRRVLSKPSPTKMICCW